MAIRHHNPLHFDFQHAGFSAFEGRPSPAIKHRHNEIELVVFEHGSLTALYGGRQMIVPPERLVLLWGAMPHRTLHLESRTIGHGIRVPLPWVLQWKLPDSVVQPLLNFDVLRGRKQSAPCSDLALVKHWVRRMQSGQSSDREMVLLEIHARLLRFAADLKSPTRGLALDDAPLLGSGVGLFERILQIVSDRYQSPLRIPQIASELGISRTHVMRHFRKLTGMTLLEYITQRRVSCAQQLLTTTDMKMIDIAYAAGFNSPARFYACFHRVVGHSPTRYRKTVQAAQ